jgi:hypothetical protein
MNKIHPYSPIIGPLQGYFRAVNRGPQSVSYPGMPTMPGRIKDYVEFPNLVVTTGKAMLALLLTGMPGPFARNIAIGTGTTTPVIGDTTLTDETGTRVSATFAITATTAYYTGVFTADNPPGAEEITEYGLLSLAAAGFLFVHATAGSIAKATADSLEVEYRIAVT